MRFAPPARQLPLTLADLGRKMPFEFPLLVHLVSGVVKRKRIGQVGTRVDQQFSVLSVCRATVSVTEINPVTDDPSAG